MGLADLFKPKASRQDIAEIVANATYRTLADPNLDESVVRPFEDEGCNKGREAILREVYYLLELGNHIAFSGRTRNTAKTTDLAQRCTDLLTPKLSEMGLWPAEDSVELVLCINSPLLCTTS